MSSTALRPRYRPPVTGTIAAEGGAAKAERTRRRLILAAERLLGQRGIANVSQRMIQQAAGQRNAAAVTYYFGSFEQLVIEVFRMRMTAINARRMTMLGESSPSIRALASAFIVPLADELMPRPEGNHYLRFLLQYRTDQNFLRLALPPSLIEGMLVAAERYVEQRPDLSAEESEDRCMLCIDMVVHALAVTEMKLEFERPMIADWRRRVEARIKSLEDAVTAILER